MLYLFWHGKSWNCHGHGHGYVGEQAGGHIEKWLILAGYIYMVIIFL